jgi:hypothetical protein
VNEEHQKFGDLLLPSRVTQKMAGAGLAQTMVIDSVEYDHVPDSMFEPPAEIRALLRSIEQEKKAAEEKKAAAAKKALDDKKSNDQKAEPPKESVPAKKPAI